jgi:twitching motility two-component system response regulator PilH
MSIHKIMIVDDSPTERHVLSDTLIKNGFDVIAVESGDAAVVRVRDIMPDLILMDVVMPGLNGFQATRAISRDPATKHIPIVICTTKGQDTDKFWGLRQGAKGYIVKPVKQEELMRVITTLNGPNPELLETDAE